MLYAINHRKRVIVEINVLNRVAALIKSNE